MAYELPKEVAEFEAGGDGYDLNDLFTNIVRGTTLTYDDIIFMPGKLFFLIWCDDVFIHDRLQKRKFMMSLFLLLSTCLFFILIKYQF